MRPSIFTTELASEICTRISHGESARQVCRDAHMPALSTLMKWLNDTDKVEFTEQYTRARDLQSDFYADQIVDLADEIPEGADANEINRRRLQIDSRKWKCARMTPRKWGDKSALDVTSSDDSFRPTMIKLVAAEAPSE